MSVKKLHSENRKEHYNTLNRTNKTVQELSEKWPKGRKETLTRRSSRKVVKKKNPKKITKDRQPGERRLQQNP